MHVCPKTDVPSRRRYDLLNSRDGLINNVLLQKSLLCSGVDWKILKSEDGRSIVFDSLVNLATVLKIKTA